MKWLATVLCFIASVGLSDIIPPDRRCDWSTNNCGIPGGIPERAYDPFTNMSSILPFNGTTTDVSGYIQNAIQNATNGSVISIPSGTYQFNSAITINKSITIRGAGMDQTVLLGNASVDSGLGGQIVIAPTSNGTMSTRPITVGASQFSNSITLASAPTGLQINWVATIDQLNDDQSLANQLVIPAGNQQTSASSSFDVRGDGTRVNSQTVLVTNISGNTVNFSPPLVWNFSKSPELVYWTAGSYPRVTHAGIESFTVKNINTSCGANGPNIYFNRSDFCWAKNVKSVDSDYDHMRLRRGFRYEVRGCYITNRCHYPTSTGYGINICQGSSFCLVEDNICNQTRDSIRIMGSCVGNAILYNYSVNQTNLTTDPTWNVKNGGIHASHPMFNLWEGNIRKLIRLTKAVQGDQAEQDCECDFHGLIKMVFPKFVSV